MARKASAKAPVEPEEVDEISAVIDTLREGIGEDEAGKVVTLSTGYRAIFHPVPPITIREAHARIPDPEPPMEFNESKGRDEPNPLNEEYLRRKDEAAEKRETAGLDLQVVMGVELVDGVPPREEWLPKLKLLEKLGHLDLSKWDLNDPLELEYLFKSRVAVTRTDLRRIVNVSIGLTEEEVARTEATFRRNSGRGAD